MKKPNLGVAIYVPTALGGVKSVTLSLAEAIEENGYQVYRCTSILGLIRARISGINSAILSLHSGIVTPFFRNTILIVHGFPMKPTHTELESLIINYLVVFAKNFGAITVGVSDFTSVIYQKIFGIKLDITIQNGVSSEFYRNPKQGPKSKLVLFAGRFDQNKNPIGVLNAFLESDLPSRGYSLAFVGNGPLKTQIQELARLESAIKLVGEVSELEKIRLFREAEIFISLHNLEPMGVVFAEAMVCHCKIVCPNTGGHLGLFPMGYPIFLTSHHDKQSVVDALNIDHTFPQFNYRAIAEKYIQLLEV